MCKMDKRVETRSQLNIPTAISIGIYFIFIIAQPPPNLNNGDDHAICLDEIERGDGALPPPSSLSDVNDYVISLEGIAGGGDSAAAPPTSNLSNGSYCMKCLGDFRRHEGVRELRPYCQYLL
ncbi:hypothetical protein AMTR_s00060p00073780 [Amborella trichopoda]|uniref:Uncharacterized protein n=1 Tax=Amborella trichopoda TaxID=13333 RepID=W1NK38_AMBTC|nr:hypothetical protein AMTR_s00060p00073780 [Amborella trichopoda]